ncbi:hypothetical protein C8Q76DRAFT_798993 [Earliella scabrosa]|nr:hypothetical protein C8Q76DRAFT_798993 [Earliella scabrosa]
MSSRPRRTQVADNTATDAEWDTVSEPLDDAGCDQRLPCDQCNARELPDHCRYQRNINFIPLPASPPPAKTTARVAESHARSRVPRPQYTSPTRPPPLRTDKPVKAASGMVRHHASPRPDVPDSPGTDRSSRSTTPDDSSDTDESDVSDSLSYLQQSSPPRCALGSTSQDAKAPHAPDRLVTPTGTKHTDAIDVRTEDWDQLRGGSVPETRSDVLDGPLANDGATAGVSLAQASRGSRSPSGLNSGLRRDAPHAYLTSQGVAATATHATQRTHIPSRPDKHDSDEHETYPLATEVRERCVSSRTTQSNMPPRNRVPRSPPLTGTRPPTPSHTPPSSPLHVSTAMSVDIYDAGPQEPSSTVGEHPRGRESQAEQAIVAHDFLTQRPQHTYSPAHVSHINSEPVAPSHSDLPQAHSPAAGNGQYRAHGLTVHGGPSNPLPYTTYPHGQPVTATNAVPAYRDQQGVNSSLSLADAIGNDWEYMLRYLHPDPGTNVAGVAQSPAPFAHDNLNAPQTHHVSASTNAPAWLTSQPETRQETVATAPATVLYAPRPLLATSGVVRYTGTHHSVPQLTDNSVHTDLAYLQHADVRADNPAHEFEVSRTYQYYYGTGPPTQDQPGEVAADLADIYTTGDLIQYPGAGFAHETYL